MNSKEKLNPEGPFIFPSLAEPENITDHRALTAKVIAPLPYLENTDPVSALDIVCHWGLNDAQVSHDSFPAKPDKIGATTDQGLFNKTASAVEQKTEPWKCSSCQKLNKDDESWCISCGALRGVEVNPQGWGACFSSLEASNNNKWKCQTCSSMNQADSAKCIACETPFPLTDSAEQNK